MAVVTNPSITITVPIDPKNYRKISTKMHYISQFFVLYFLVIFVSYWDSDKEKYIPESTGR